MGPEDNKAIARRLIEALNRGDIDGVAQHFAPDYVDHALPPGSPPGPEGFKQFFGLLRKAFPDFRYTLEDEVAEGDMLVHRLTGHGTMKGEFQGMPPTGKHAEWSEMHLARISNGKVMEHWAVVDQLDMLQKLGLMPQAQPG